MTNTPAIFSEPILVVHQKAKLIEVTDEYAISDQDGTQIGAVSLAVDTALEQDSRGLN